MFHLASNAHKMILLLICFEEGSGGICIYDYDYITHDSDQTVNIIEKGVVFQLGFSTALNCLDFTEFQGIPSSDYHLSGQVNLFFWVKGNQFETAFGRPRRTSNLEKHPKIKFAIHQFHQCLFLHS